MGLDISGPLPLTGGKWNKAIKEKLYWYGLSDHYSKKILMNFGHNKSQIVIFFRQAHDFMKTCGTPIQTIKMDNSGENKEVEKICKNELNIGVEYTPPDTPKSNGVVERGFTISLEKAKILMQNAGLKDEVRRRKKIVIKAITMASYLVEECPQKGLALSPNDLFFGTN